MAYTQDQINSALTTTLKNNPNVSYTDLLNAAGTYGLSRDQLNSSLSAVGAPAYLTNYDQYAGPAADSMKWNPSSGLMQKDSLIGVSGGSTQSAAPAQQFNPAQTQFGSPWNYNQKNPYLSQMADSIKSQVNDNLQRNIMPNISSGAQLVGGYGGSRQGVVEANALKDANQTLSNSLTNMYYGDYNNAMNRQLQKYGMDQSYNLGLGGLQLGNRNTDLNAVQLGANLVNQSNQGYLGQGQGIYNLGLTQQQSPWQTVSNMNSAVTPYTGYGTQSMTQNGSAAGGALGGAVLGSQLYKNLGLNNSTGYNVTPYNTNTVGQMSQSLMGAGYWTGN